MKLSELYKRVKAGYCISLNDYLKNPPHVYEVIPANPGQDVFITMYEMSIPKLGPKQDKT